MAFVEKNRTHEHLTTAAKANMFSDIIDKYYSKDCTSEEVIDEIFLELYESPDLRQFINTIDEGRPAYSGVYRYDPLSIYVSEGDGCFRSPISYGASTAFGRIFKDLTSDKVHVVRTDDEAMVVIDHPSFLIDRNRGNSHETEPTILFTSKQFGKLGLYGSPPPTEEFQYGMYIAHGDSASSVRPNTNLSSSEVDLAYLYYSIEEESKIEQL